MNSYYLQKLTPYINQYIKMRVGDFIIHCPYWMNRIKDGKVVLRGEFNGKGMAGEIQITLAKRWAKYLKKNPHDNSEEKLYKFAKRERIGIDCSGLAFGILNELIKIGFCKTQYLGLDDVFKGGINRTSARMLTDDEFSIMIKDSKARLGDLININGGKHVALVLSANNGLITYIHSHPKTEKKGVHMGKIEITDVSKPLNYQKWLEKTNNGENFRDRYFHPELGDGLFRLKIFS